MVPTVSVKVGFISMKRANCTGILLSTFISLLLVFLPLATVIAAVPVIKVIEKQAQKLTEAEKNLGSWQVIQVDDEIEALAVHYTSKSFVAASQPFDVVKATMEAKIHKVPCIKCHEDGGSSKNDDVGILAGQWSPYLRTSLNNFRTDKRDTEPKMLKLVKNLSEKEIDALVNFWASQQ